MKILVVEPMKQPYEREIQGALEEMQAIVGGYIEEITPFDDNAVIIANEEGKLLGLPYNRALHDNRGLPYDIICGTFFMVSHDEETYTSLSDNLMQKYKEMYSNEMVLSVPDNKPKKENHSHER